MQVRNSSANPLPALPGQTHLWIDLIEDMKPPSSAHTAETEGTTGTAETEASDASEKATETERSEKAVAAPTERDPLRTRLRHMALVAQGKLSYQKMRNKRVGGGWVGTLPDYAMWVWNNMNEQERQVADELYSSNPPRTYQQQRESYKNPQVRMTEHDLMLYNVNREFYAESRHGSLRSHPQSGDRNKITCEKALLWIQQIAEPDAEDARRSRDSMEYDLRNFVSSRSTDRLSPSEISRAEAGSENTDSLLFAYPMSSETSPNLAGVLEVKKHHFAGSIPVSSTHLAPSNDY
jgi:hypothetical protein